MKQHIYADNAATTQLDSEVFEAMIPWLVDEYGNTSQPYSFSRKPKKALQEAREIIARCINAQPDEIFFTSGGTESDNWVIKGSAFSDESKKLTITSAIEHHAVLNSCAFIEKIGYPVVYLKPDKQGIVSAKKLRKVISDDTRLVSVMLVNNELGTIEPIKELAEVAHQYGALCHTDAVQAIGHIPVDVRDLGIDMLSASAHKFNGPKGVGFLFDKSKSISSLNDGGSQEYGRRAGTENVASIVGMAVALKNNCDNLQKNIKQISELEKHFFEMLNQSGLDYVRNGSDNHAPGIISISFKGADGESILHRLDLMGISISTGAACDSVNTQVSHVIRSIHVPRDYAKGTIRVSLGKRNTVDDCKTIVKAIASVLIN